MRRRLAAVLRVCVRGMLLLVVLLALAWVFRVPLFGGLVKDEIQTQLQRAIGGRWEIESVGGNWISELRIEGLRLTEAPADGPLAGLTLDEATATYDLLGLLGDDPLAALESIDVQGGQVALDLTRPAGDGANASGDAPSFDALDLLEMRVSVETDVVVDVGADPIRVQGLRLAHGPDVALELSAQDVSLPDRFEVQGPFAGRVERTGQDVWLWKSDAVLGGVRVPRATIARAGRVDARIVVAGGHIDVAITGETLEAQADALDLARLPGWVSGFMPKDVPLPDAGSLRGDLTYRLVQAAPPHAFGATVERLRWRGESIQSAGVRGTWRSTGRVLVSEAHITGDHVHVQGRNVTLLTSLPFLVHRADALIVDIASVRALRRDLTRDAAVSLRLACDGPHAMRIEQLRVTSGQDRFEATGTATLPSQPADWQGTVVDLAFRSDISDPAPLNLALQGRATVEGRAEGPLEAVRVVADMGGPPVRIHGRSITSARLDAMVRWPDVTVDAMNLGASGVRLEATGRLSLDPPRVLDALYVVDASDLALASELLPENPPLSGSLRAEGRAAWDGRDFTTSVHVVGANLDVRGMQAETLDARARLDGQRVVVEALDARGAYGDVHAAAEVDPKAQRVRIENLSFLRGELAAHLLSPATVAWDADEIRLDELEADVDGARVRGEITVRPDGRRVEVARLSVVDGDSRIQLKSPLVASWAGALVEVADLALTVNDDTDVRASLRADLDAEVAEVGRLVIHGPFGDAVLEAPLGIAHIEDEFVVRGLRASIAGVGVVGAGRLIPEASKAIVDEFAAVVDGVEMVLNQPLAVGWGRDGFEATGLDVALLGGRVTGHARWGDAPTADLDVEGIRLDGRLDEVRGTLTARVQVSRAGLLVDANVPDLDFRGWRGVFALRARQDEAGPLTLERIHLAGPENRVLSGMATLPIRLDARGVERLPDTLPALALDGALGGLGALTKAAVGPIFVRARGRAGGLDVSLKASNLVPRGPGQPPGDALCDLHISPSAVTGRLALSSEEFADVRCRVGVDAGFDWTRPETWETFVDTGTVDARLDADVRSWQPLVRATDAIRRLEGGARAEITVLGPLRSPDVRGSVTLSDVWLTMDTDVAPFQSVDARLVWQDDLIRVETLEGEMGHAPFRLGGTVRLAPDTLPVADLALHCRNTQLLRTEWVRMRIDVDSRITGPVDRLLVSGKGTVVEALFSKPLSLSGLGSTGDSPELVLFEFRNPPFSQMTFDLAVQAKESIRVRNNILKVNVSYEGALRGTGARPAFEGRAFFRNAEIHLPLSTLRNGAGEIAFLPDAPGRPRIQMIAQTRTKGYEMGVQVAGRLPDVNLHVFTEPHLDDEDAILMLATGSTGAELAEGGIAAKALSAVLSVFGGSLITTRGAEGEPGEKAFFERFDFTSDWSGPRIKSVDGEIELNRRLYLHLQRDRYESTNIGLIWRFRFR